ncbi:hypothetical protein I4F81_004823 [Pyropia yezoensis]|uniref:Uncharacterized protein n=1 Tax=Pyropia yezoensis TaxID=2788 RepID=A0ACC3BW59_PYRYE|nr:hypothetical protein I4F81_004823 [Neopyropia yezoensis]
MGLDRGDGGFPTPIPHPHSSPTHPHSSSSPPFPTLSHPSIAMTGGDAAGGSHGRSGEGHEEGGWAGGGGGGGSPPPFVPAPLSHPSPFLPSRGRRRMGFPRAHHHTGTRVPPHFPPLPRAAFHPCLSPRRRGEAVGAGAAADGWRMAGGGWRAARGGRLAAACVLRAPAGWGGTHRRRARPVGSAGRLSAADGGRGRNLKSGRPVAGSGDGRPHPLQHPHCHPRSDTSPPPLSRCSCLSSRQDGVLPQGGRPRHCRHRRRGAGARRRRAGEQLQVQVQREQLQAPPPLLPPPPLCAAAPAAATATTAAAGSPTAARPPGAGAPSRTGACAGAGAARATCTGAGTADARAAAAVAAVAAVAAAAAAAGAAAAIAAHPRGAAVQLCGRPLRGPAGMPDGRGGPRRRCHLPLLHGPLWGVCQWRGALLGGLCLHGGGVRGAQVLGVNEGWAPNSARGCCAASVAPRGRGGTFDDTVFPSVGGSWRGLKLRGHPHRAGR